MKRMLLSGCLLAGLAGIAAAQPVPRTLVGEVGADPRDGYDNVNLHQAWASHLAIVAENAPVDIRSITLHMSDDRDYVVPANVQLRPGEQTVFALPCRTRCTVNAISLHYGEQRQDRTPARARVYAIDETNAPRHLRHAAYDPNRPYENYPSVHR